VRTAGIYAACVVGLILMAGFVAAFDSGRDRSGESVRAERWADDVCKTVGAYEGQLEEIGDDMSLNNVGARQNDGGSGDSVEGTVYVRGVVVRAIDATQDTLQEGIKRAGVPDAPQGAQAAQIFGTWAQQTEDALNGVHNAFRGSNPGSTAAAFAYLGAAVSALERSAVAGRAAFAEAAALDPALASAFEGSRTCRRLQEDQP
jgi:hypothetical protein